jgi:hypothetical protein
LSFALWLLALRRRRRATSRDILLLSWLALACSDGASDGSSPGAADLTNGAEPAASSADCGGAGEEFMLGMTKSAPSGALIVAIVAAEPAPPLVGANRWTVQLSGEGGDSIAGASVSFTGWMPQHGHGLNAVPLIEELEGGRYEIQPIILYMPQLWELGVVVTQNGERERVTFGFCVP